MRKDETRYEASAEKIGFGKILFFGEERRRQGLYERV